MFKLERRRVWELALGLDRGWWAVGFAVVLIAYNLARAGMTSLIGPMRDHADQVGRSPAWIEYKRLWLAHRVLSWMLLVAVAAGVLKIAGALWLPLLAPD